MLLNEKHIKQFAGFYLACFLVNYAWFFYYGLLFSSLQPVFFLNKLDFTFSILLFSNLQHALIKSNSLRVAFDLIYLLLPVILVYTCFTNKKVLPFMAILTSVFSLVYSLYFSSVTFMTPPGFAAWTLVPLIFYTTSVKGFYYNFHSLRIVFILLFFSAALWKIYEGGVFNSEGMSSILLFQHVNYLVADAHTLYARFITWLIRHTYITYSFYLLGFFAEFVFITGLFTRKYDRFLILMFCLFLLFDYILMAINLFSWAPFMGCFYFSRFILSERAK